MKEIILKKIDAAVRPKLKTELSEIAELEKRLAGMQEQETKFLAQLSKAQADIMALESEMTDMLVRFANPDEIARVSAALREKRPWPKICSRGLRGLMIAQKET